MGSIPHPTDREYQEFIDTLCEEIRSQPCFRTNGHGAKGRPYDVSGEPRRTFAEFMASFERKGGKR